MVEANELNDNANIKITYAIQFTGYQRVEYGQNITWNVEYFPN